MQVTIFANETSQAAVRNWIAYELLGFYSQPKNQTVVQVKEAEFLPDWIKKHTFNDNRKIVGAMHLPSGYFFVGKHGEWISISNDGIVKLGGQFHELQYYFNIIRNAGPVMGWTYHGNHPEHIKCAPWEIAVESVETAPVLRYSLSRPSIDLEPAIAKFFNAPTLTVG